MQNFVIRKQLFTWHEVNLVLAPLADKWKSQPPKCKGKFTLPSQLCQISEKQPGGLDELASDKAKLLEKESAELEDQAKRFNGVNTP
jgi:hypothetical protein